MDEIDSSPSKKNSRYLREMDRRTILARLDRGEKQSALAKEFRVTRAAICNLNKHRDLVLSRQHEDPLAKHPKKAKHRQDSEDEEDVEVSIRSGSNRVSLLLSEDSHQPAVRTVALQPAERLIPLLLSRDTTDAAFRRYCDRLMTMVVEEVLAWAHSEARNNIPASGKLPTPCGVSIAPGGSPMLSVFQALEPELPTGHIKLSLPQIGSPVAVVLDLPALVASHSVCLFYAFTDAVGGVRVAKSIRELLNRGAVEELLCLVTLAVSALTVDELQRAHPSMRIAAAHVESREDIDDWIQCSRGLENQNQNVTGEILRSTSRLELLANRVADIY
ncbi:putative uracil phosphoribosyltransferase [Phytophthora cinnamomi]|uniref:putative uracil phosphoribosyltransferase n=1 Tax=Phytophthora cinnamomi TaxID=4785 RepID=UPI00355979C9|nr:putative uracil phosphoribosyltransferase [Phytophthora cinnamomi]